jgi:GTP-binding protein
VAHVSKTPGRTQLLNCFAVGEAGGPTVIDCPGYGYASVSKATRASWQAMIEDYLLEREPLTMILVLVDGEIGPTKLDVQLLGWLRDNALPHTVVATKHDKVKSSQREKRKRDLAAACDLDRTDVVWVSATKNVGIDRLRDLVRLWLGLA